MRANQFGYGYAQVVPNPEQLKVNRYIASKSFVISIYSRTANVLHGGTISSIFAGNSYSFNTILILFDLCQKSVTQVVMPTS